MNFNMNSDSEFTFIDLFAGIGGIRIAFERVRGKCVFSSEWDRFAQQTYEANFGEKPKGDITKIPSSEIPDHDILVAGFPCQPFSIAGVSAKNALGRAHGFKDEQQGNLFFSIADILEIKRPKAFLLENVKHLKNHDKGKTFSTIKDILLNLNYHIFYKIVDGQYYVPQHRERIFIVGFNKDHYPEINFIFPSHPENKPKVLDILDKRVDKKYRLIAL